ncbi:hypothetical protein FPOAC2_00643 [Fusarium poae]
MLSIDRPTCIYSKPVPGNETPPAGIQGSGPLATTLYDDPLLPYQSFQSIPIQKVSLKGLAFLTLLCMCTWGWPLKKQSQMPVMESLEAVFPYLERLVCFCFCF